MASLGITRDQVGKVFHHSVYDGVYASPEERVKGGGCLSLNKHFADWCDIPSDSFSGNWDMGHKLQLVYGDVLLADDNVKTLNKLVFSSMGDFTSGQRGLKFKELSKELNQPTLSNKKFQETRWVRQPTTVLKQARSSSPSLKPLVRTIGTRTLRSVQPRK